MMMGFGFIGLLFMLLFWGGLIALAVWVAKELFGDRSRSVKGRGENELNANEILSRRYARGEISRQEYELMKEDLL